MNLTQPLGDNDPFPFGKYKGCKMVQVPASYLLWLADEEWLEEEYPEVYDYIEDNYDVLTHELKQ